MRAIVTGDIGCYTLGALPPLSAMDTTVDMGASVSMAHGFELALADTEHRPIVAVIGDSTFAHSGLSSLISTVYNRGAGTVCVLDNRTTAMTGRQGNPFNGVTLQNRPSAARRQGAPSSIPRCASAAATAPSTAASTPSSRNRRPFMENATKTVLLCGVGGQGTILAADLLAFSCMKANLQVKVSEIHGMAQRGGAVTTVVRVGEDVKSMVSDAGCADVVVAFETTEALRNLPQLKEGGSLIVNDVAIRPLPVLTGAASMPENARERLREAGALLIDADAIARAAGNAKCANVVLVGALAARLDIPVEVWEETVAERVPQKTVEANLAALRAGRAVIENEEGE